MGMKVLAMGVSGAFVVFAPLDMAGMPPIMTHVPAFLASYWLLTFRVNRQTFELMEEIVDKYDIQEEDLMKLSEEDDVKKLNE